MITWFHCHATRQPAWSTHNAAHTTQDIQRNITASIFSGGSLSDNHHKKLINLNASYSVCESLVPRMPEGL
jgi:hypothetical protein